MQPETSTIDANGISLSYQHWPGEKGPIFCLPSLTGHKGSFASVAPRLAPEYDVYALDLRGRGDSGKPAEGYGFAYHTHDLLGFADALGFETFIIVGHSFGATVGVYLASIRPRRVQAIVMLEGGADPKDEILRAMRPLVRHLDKVYPSMDDYLAAMRAIPYFQPWNRTLETYLREDVRLAADGSVRAKTSPEAIARDLDIHFSYSMCLHFPAMRCPALFVRPTEGLLGDRGHVFTEREVAAIVAWIPEGRWVDVRGANHYTMVLQDEPPVVPPIQAFLAEVLSAPARPKVEHSLIGF